jgi:hypothetical protein
MFIYTTFDGPGRDRPPIRPRAPRRRPLRAVRAPGAPWRLPGEVPAHGSDGFRVWSLWLGHRLADDGAAPLEAHLARFAAIAIELGVEVEAAAVVADTARDDVTRSRAYFKVAMALDELEPIGPDDGPVAA